MTVVMLRRARSSLADWRAIWRGAPRRRRSRPCRAGVAASAAAVERIVARGRAGLRHQHRVRQAGERAHRGGRSGAAAAQHRAVARGRRRRAAPRSPIDAADDGAEAREPRAGRLGRPARDAWHCSRRCWTAGVTPGRAGPGLGRRLGRSGAARAHGGGDDRRRRGLDRRPDACRPPRRSPRPASSRSSSAQGRAGAAQRHPVLDRLRAGRPVRGRDAVPACRWSTGALVDRGGAGSDTPFDPRIHALRGHRGQIEVAAALRALMAGSADPRLALTGDDPRAGPVLPALPAAGDGRRRSTCCARPRDTLRDRGQRRLRQPADLRRATDDSALGRQFPRRAGRLRRRHDRARGLRDRLARRAPHRHAGRSGAVRPAGVPDAASPASTPAS